MGKVITCKIQTNGILKDIPGIKSLHITSGQIIPIEGNANVKFYLDAACFADGKLMPDTKWAFIFEKYYAEIPDKKGEQNDLWADIGNAQNQFIDVKGIGKQYKTGNEFSISPAGTSYYYGYKQRVLIFIENAAEPFHFFIIPYLNTSSISFAYFENSEKIRRYGDTMHLQILLHQYPDNIRRKGNFDALVYILEKKDAVSANGTSDFEEKNVLSAPIKKHLGFTDYAISDSINTMIDINFIIDMAWRKDDKEDKIFTAVIEIYETTQEELLKIPYKSVAEPIVMNFGKEPTKSLKRYNAKLLDMEPLQQEKDPLYSEFKVSEETMDAFLERKEVDKTNMIQYIGDISYTKKENNPCAYSTITVKEGTRSVTLFDEFHLGNKLSDITAASFDIVAGDKEKTKVTVIAKFKKDKAAKEEPIHIGESYMCESILNDGHKHSLPEDVFKMKYIVGQWKPSSDPSRLLDRLLNFSSINNLQFYHPDNAVKAPLLKTAAPEVQQYGNDQDSKGIPNKAAGAEQFKMVSVAEIQGLTTKDYKIEKDTVSLELGYVYNKVYENKIGSYLASQEVFEGGALSKSVKNIWVFRYLLMLIKSEKIYQTYFVPVSTCRYPNQLARIHVYPDMKWVFNFNYNIKTPVYYRPTQRMIDHYVGADESDGVSTNNSRTRTEMRDTTFGSVMQTSGAGRKTSFKLGVECEVSGEDDVIDLSAEMGEKYRKMLSPLISIVNRLNSDLGVDEARTEHDRIRSTGGTGVMARFRNFPMSFELESPNIGVGVGIGFGGTKTGSIGYELEGRIVASPLIRANIKIDVLALGSKLKPWGLIIDALDLASWAANFLSSGKVQLNYKIEVRFTAEIKLVGKKTGTDSKTKEPLYEPDVNMKYNFGDKQLKFDGGIMGKITGEIEISLEIKIVAKVQSATTTRVDEKRDVAQAGIGASAKSEVRLICPFKLNNGGLELDLYFSGVKLEVWFKANLGTKDEDGEPDVTKTLVPKIELKKKIQFQ
jgi:hypothetical protein